MINYKSLIMLFTLLTCLISSSSCSLKKEEAREATTDFREKYKRGEYKKIYDESALDFKKATSEKDFIAFMEGVTRKLGQLKSTKEVNWRTFTGTRGRQVTLFCDSKFEQGDAKEQFTWGVFGKELKLLGYHINSPVFVTK